MGFRSRLLVSRRWFSVVSPVYDTRESFRSFPGKCLAATAFNALRDYTSVYATAKTSLFNVELLKGSGLWKPSEIIIQFEQYFYFSFDISNIFSFYKCSHLSMNIHQHVISMIYPPTLFTILKISAQISVQTCSIIWIRTRLEGVARFNILQTVSFRHDRHT